MGKHPLGHDLSVRLVTGHKVWEVLTPAVAGQNKVIAAIADVGPDADQVLPLSRGTTVIVNASHGAVRRGTTDPRVLLRWHRAGVQIYSLDSLHAKLILVDNREPFVATGSMNVSNNSAQRMFEAVMISDMSDAISAAREAFSAILAQAGDPLTEARLVRLEGIFGSDQPKPTIHHADDADADGDAGGKRDVNYPWPTPRTIHLMTASGPTPLSSGAREQLDVLETELGVSLEIDSDGPPSDGEFRLFAHAITEDRTAVRPFGWPVSKNEHVVLVKVPTPTGGPRLTSELEPPARVVGAWTDDLEYPRRKYYFLVGRHWSPRRTHRDLETALKPWGQKSMFAQPYITADKVQAIVGLWPGATYDE